MGKIMGSSLQSSCLFGWHSLSSSITSFVLFGDLFFFRLSGVYGCFSSLCKKKRFNETCDCSEYHSVTVAATEELKQAKALLVSWQKASLLAGCYATVPLELQRLCHILVLVNLWATHIDSQQSTHTKQCNMYHHNDGQRDSVRLSTVAQMPIDSLWSSRFLCGDVALTQASDDSAYIVKVSLI